jgi:WhiB family redox-sensing transcriptional regulator
MTGYLSRVHSPDLPQAACTNANPELFFAEDCVNPNAEAIAEARAICSPCAERINCLMWGLQNENFGMWGGLTANERRYYRQGKLYKLTQVRELGLI